MTGSGPTKPQLPATPPQVVPEVVTQLIALQTRQLEVRQQEIDVQRLATDTERKKVDNAHEYSLKVLDAQVTDRKDERARDAKDTRYGFWVSLAFIFGFFLLTGYALVANKDQLLLEAIKVIALAGGGGGVGYVLGFKKGKETAEDDETPSASA